MLTSVYSFMLLQDGEKLITLIIMQANATSKKDKRYEHTACHRRTITILHVLTNGESITLG